MPCLRSWIFQLSDTALVYSYSNGEFPYTKMFLCLHTVKNSERMVYYTMFAIGVGSPRIFCHDSLALVTFVDRKETAKIAKSLMMRKHLNSVTGMLPAHHSALEKLQHSAPWGDASCHWLTIYSLVHGAFSHIRRLFFFLAYSSC